MWVQMTFSVEDTATFQAFSFIALHFIFQDRVSHWICSSLLWLEQLASKLQEFSCLHSTRISSFYVGAEDLYSGLYSCTSALSTQAFSNPQSCKPEKEKQMRFQMHFLNSQHHCFLHIRALWGFSFLCVMVGGWGTSLLFLVFVFCVRFSVFVPSLGVAPNPISVILFVYFFPISVIWCLTQGWTC